MIIWNVLGCKSMRSGKMRFLIKRGETGEWWSVIKDMSWEQIFGSSIRGMCCLPTRPPGHPGFQ